MKKKYIKELPPSESAVFHLRVGDVIDVKIDPVKYPNITPPTAADFFKRRTSSYPHWGSPQWSFYVDCKNDIDHKLTKLKQMNVKNIILVYGVHSKGDFPETRMYLAMYKLYCEDNGFDVTLKTHDDADESFVYLASASIFSPSSGGFSKLLKRIVKYNRMVCI